VAPKKFRKDDRMVTRVQMGSATVVICKVVPDAVDSPVRVDKVKEAGGTPNKTGSSGGFPFFF